MIFLLVFFSNLMHLSMLSPRGGGRAYLGNLTQSPLPWLGNSRKFDKTHDPEGGDV